MGVSGPGNNGTEACLLSERRGWGCFGALTTCCVFSPGDFLVK